MKEFYEKLLVGRYLEFDDQRKVPNDGPAYKDVQRVQRELLHLSASESMSRPHKRGGLGKDPSKDIPEYESDNTIFAVLNSKRKELQHTLGNPIFRQRVSVVKDGGSSEGHRIFIWLPWLPGKVSEVAPQGIDVLTGPFTGCWVTSYTRMGTRFVGHVGTEGWKTSPASLRAKAAWNEMIPLLSSYSGFEPASATSTQVKTSKAGGTRNVYALVTARGQFYAIVTFNVRGRPERKLIAAVVEAHDTLPPLGQIP